MVAVVVAAAVAAGAAASHRDSCIFVPFCSQPLISQVVIASCSHSRRSACKKKLFLLSLVNYRKKTTEFQS